MSSQDTENQLGGAPAIDAIEDENYSPVVEPQRDQVTPQEKLRADALALIIAARVLGRNPVELINVVLNEIGD